MLIKKRKVINWGIIGLGKIAHKFSQDLIKVEDTKLYAVASRNQNKANDFATKYTVEKAYGDYESLAKDPKIDAVYIATPHSFHKEHTILCLNHKKAVLCEKPFAMNSDEVEEMITLSKRNNVLLMEALWTFFLPHYQFALKHINNETFGSIKCLEADFGFNAKKDRSSRLFKKSLGGGSLLDIGIYPVFAALSTLGEPIQIKATANFFENGVDTNCQILFKYSNGAKAKLKSTLIEDTATEAIFHCKHGTIRINSRFHEPSSVTIISEEKTRTFDFECESNGYDYEIRHFNELLRQEKSESDIMTVSFSRKLIKLLDLIRLEIGLDYD
jgi:predicted dehydrogenase